MNKVYMAKAESMLKIKISIMRHLFKNFEKGKEYEQS